MATTLTWRVRLGAVALAATTFAAACGGGGGGSADGGGSPTSTPEVCTGEQRTPKMTMGTFAQPTTLDATVGSGRSTNGGIEMAALYDTLMELDTKTDKYEPRLAKSLTPSADHKTWTLGLRENVKFGNGDVLDAAAVKASLELVKRDKNTNPSRGLSMNITAMDVVDPLTLKITLNDSWPTFPFLLAGSAGMIVNAKLVAERGDADFGKNPTGAGAGPFELVRYAPGEETLLKAKADYWGGPVCVEQLRFVTIAGGKGTYDAFEVGELDVALLRDPTVIAEASDTGVDAYRSLYNLTSFLLVNHGARGAVTPTTDPVVRQAIGAALDPKLLDQRANGGNGFPSSAIVHPESGLAAVAADLKGVSYDPEKARQLVSQAKANGWDGKLRVVAYNTPDRIELSLAVQAQLEAAGIDVVLDNQNTVNDFIKKIRVDGNYDLAVWGIFVEDGAPWAALDGFRSDNVQNLGGYKDPNMDAALLELKHAVEPAQVGAALRKVQAAWNDTLPAIAWAAAEDVVIWAKDVHGLEFSQDTLMFFNHAFKAG